MDTEGLDAVYAGFREREHVPGLAYGVVRNGELAHHGWLGDRRLGDPPSPVTAETAFRIASMTKAFTALTVLALRDEGLLRLDDAIAAHVPQLRGHPRVTADSPETTVRQLLSHLGGDVNDDPWGDRQLGLGADAFSSHLDAGWPRARPPGLAMEYSNLGYALLGRVIEGATGRAYQQIVTERLLRPLGMAASGFDVLQARQLATGYRFQDGRASAEAAEPDGAFGAMGGLVTTVSDYARWAAFLLDAWPPRDDPDTGPVRRATVRELGLGYGPPGQLGIAGAAAARLPAVYGHGVWVARDPELGLGILHSGGLPGYGSHVWLLPERGAAVFAFANRTYAPVRDVNREALLALAAAGELPEPHVWPPTVSDAVRAAAEAAALGYDTGSLAHLPAAENLFADKPAELREREVAELRERFGERLGLTVHEEHALACSFTLRCERGTVDGDLLLTPTTPPALQWLAFEAGSA